MTGPLHERLAQARQRELSARAERPGGRASLRILLSARRRARKESRGQR